jgi:hypothetical protein
MAEESLTVRPFESQKKQVRPPTSMSSLSSTGSVQEVQRSKPSADEATLIEAFTTKFAHAKLPNHAEASHLSKKTSVQGMFTTFDAEISHAPTSRRSSSFAVAPEILQELPLSPPPEPENADYDVLSDDEDWEKIDSDEILFADATMNGLAPPIIVYQPPTFRATVSELLDRYTLSDERRQDLEGAFALLKWAGEIGYAIVSEPVVEAAEWLVRKQFGCAMEQLPDELRNRLMTSLPTNVQSAIRVTNRYVFSFCVWGVAA